jgi:zinc transporter, ZIP family
VTEALLLGLLTGGSLLAGAAIAATAHVPTRLLGLITGFGAGVLTASVAFDLVDDARARTTDGRVALWLLVGGVTFMLGDLAVERMGGSTAGELRGSRRAREQVGLAVLIGIVLDGVPESIVIGISAAQGTGVGTAFVVGVILSNVPEAMAATAGFRDGGWPRRAIGSLWLGVGAATVAAAGLGHALGDADEGFLAFVLAFAAGAILAMLADTMWPEAYREAGPEVGLAAVSGFALAVLLA